MITLNTEKGLVRIESWEDVLERPGFLSDLDPTKIELKAILGSYAFKDHVRCGLSTCHQPHGRGYLVTTMDGRETNIGKDCGKTHFSVDFETMRNAYERDFRNKARREQLEIFLGQIPAYQETIKQILDGNTGATFLHSALQVLTTRGKGLPNAIVEKILEMVRARDGRITLQRRATESEMEDREAILGKTIQRPYYIEVEIGFLVGISALYPEHNLRALLVLDISQGLEHRKQLDIGSLSDRGLLAHSKWADDLNSKLTIAKRAMREARIFLSPYNLQKLEILLHDRDDKRLFSKFLGQLKPLLGDDTSLAA